MIRFLAITIISAVLCACGKKVKKTYFEDGSIKLEITYYEGKPVYKKSFYNNGSVNWECSYRDNKENGEYKEYNENGDLILSSRFMNGLQDGIYTSYYESGEVKNRSIYKNGKKNGGSISYNPMGNILMKELIVNDSLKWFLKYNDLGKCIDEYHTYRISPAEDTVILNGNLELEIEIAGRIIKHDKIGVQYTVIGSRDSTWDIILLTNIVNMKKINFANKTKGEYNIVFYCPTLLADNSVVEHRKHLILK